MKGGDSEGEGVGKKGELEEDLRKYGQLFSYFPTEKPHLLLYTITKTSSFRQTGTTIVFQTSIYLSFIFIFLHLFSLFSEMIDSLFLFYLPHESNILFQLSFLLFAHSLLSLHFSAEAPHSLHFITLAPSLRLK